MKRACECFKNKDSRSPAKIRLDALLQPPALMIIFPDVLTNARNLGNECAPFVLNLCTALERTNL